jgi:hypothetical protein
MSQVFSLSIESKSTGDRLPGIRGLDASKSVQKISAILAACSVAGITRLVFVRTGSGCWSCGRPRLRARLSRQHPRGCGAGQGDPDAPADHGRGACVPQQAGQAVAGPTFCQYWGARQGEANLDFVVYEATKHYGLAALYSAGVSERTIAKLAGCSEGKVCDLPRIYGHADVAAQSEIDALYAESPMHEPMHDSADPAS